MFHFRFAWRGNRVEAPRLFSGLRVEGRDEPADWAVAAACPDDHLVFDDQRSVRHRIALRRLRDDRVPDRLSAPRVDGDEMRVDRRHVQRIAENRHAAIHPAAARTSLGRRRVVVSPERPPGRSVECDDVVRRLDGVHHAVDDERRRFEFLERPRLPDPLLLQALDIRVRDLRQAAVPLIEWRAGVRQPVLRLAIRVQDSIERHLRLERRGRKHRRQYDCEPDSATHRFPLSD